VAWAPGFDVQTIAQHWDGIWGDIFGWIAVLAGLAALAGLIAVLRRHRARKGPGPVDSAARLERGREWELVMRRATQELWRGPEVAALQADAAIRVEAAEHAYNRLVVDCAKVCAVSPPPTFEQAGPEPAREPKAPAPEREPLAA
jgi:hypothetical protein